MSSDPIYFLPKGISPAITPSDTIDVDAKWNHGVLVEAVGNVSVEYEDGSTHTWAVTSLPWFIYGRIKKVRNTSTTVSAGNIFTFRVGI